MLFPVTIRSSDPQNKTLICFHVERHKSRIMHKENCQFLQVHKGPNPPNHKNCHFCPLPQGTFIQPKRRCSMIALMLFNSCLTLDNMCHLQQRFSKNIWNGRTHFYYKPFKWVYHDHLICVNQLAIPICTRPS